MLSHNIKYEPLTEPGVVGSVCDMGQLGQGFVLQTGNVDQCATQPESKLIDHGIDLVIPHASKDSGVFPFNLNSFSFYHIDDVLNLEDMGSCPYKLIVLTLILAHLIFQGSPITCCVFRLNLLDLQLVWGIGLL